MLGHCRGLSQAFARFAGIGMNIASPSDKLGFAVRLPIYSSLKSPSVENVHFVTLTEAVPESGAPSLSVAVTVME
jgi:hypothetical protein